MGLFKRNKNNDLRNENITKTQYKLVTESMNGFTNWGGNAYNNDLVRSIIRIKSQAIGKAIPKHVRRTEGELKINPEPYIRELLKEPNPLMTMQQLLEKTVAQLELNNNSFIFIYRDDNGYPIQLIPIDCTGVTPAYNQSNKLFLVFDLMNGNQLTAAYSDVIHLRKDYNEDAIFGTSPLPALKGLLGVMHTMDEGIVNAIKNSTLIRWLLQFNQQLRPEDIKKQTDQFAEAFLSQEGTGVAGMDNKGEAKQIKDDSKSAQDGERDSIKERVLIFFNINEKILKGDFDENDYIAFYETCVEPIIRQLSGELTRKLFTRKERAYGNEITLEAFDMTFASMTTKLAMYQMVDRRGLTPNEWRAMMNLAPYEGGDEFVLRLDTQVHNDRNSQKDTN